MFALVFAKVSQPDILANIYYATGGPYTWFRRDNWVSKTVHVCNWYGVSCSDDGNITALDLQQNGLINSVPGDILQLQYLQRINIGQNVFEGTFVQNICTLKMLKELYLYSTNLLQTLPDCVCSMNLTVIDISHNNIIAPISACAYLNLKQYYFQCSNYSGSLSYKFDNILDVDARCTKTSGCDQRQLESLNVVQCNTGNCQQLCSTDASQMCQKVYSTSPCGDFVAANYYDEYIQNHQTTQVYSDPITPQQ